MASNDSPRATEDFVCWLWGGGGLSVAPPFFPRRTGNRQKKGGGNQAGRNCDLVARAGGGNQAKLNAAAPGPTELPSRGGRDTLRQPVNEITAKVCPWLWLFDVPPAVLGTGSILSLWVSPAVARPCGRTGPAFCRGSLEPVRRLEGQGWNRFDVPPGIARPGGSTELVQCSAGGPRSRLGVPSAGGGGG